MWRGSLLPLGCEAAPKPASCFPRKERGALNGAATQPSGSKLPRHNGCLRVHGGPSAGTIRRALK
ncbi:hypothetical protein C1X89_23110 [Pseudomonas sp. GP01-A8]|nr:hypothetical protein C1X90_24980 [Pseudomonas sp. GP01-A9]PMU26118.1 hypothetical protein C1X88_22110 [Pseudomonas sp. GP01-A13]PMU34977.1 hypothetical protein C1X89_23110 [Pseudomonas sp. GP01-A8]PMU48299.1 hypothetical protein C1X87_20200 [Pseudomonas sp. GP01-A14]PMU48446.1 hypothetical protein C1X85_30015 [Pseudomonas sp. GP01-A6]PMU62031.1 hypothetical protein C1X86_15250 [Pseudomonas sp. GP01-A3]PMU69507.1 hypothetical protein C1X81_23210 [Pseudomonas sp. FW215-L2]PMU74063.1 hypothe